MSAKEIIRVFLIITLMFFTINSRTFAGEVKKNALELDVNDAILMALENNRSFQIEKLDPEIKMLDVEKAEAAFDVSLRNTFSSSESEGSSGKSSYRTSNEAEIQKLLKSGSTVSVGLSSSNSSSSSLRYTSRIGVSIEKPLFEGAGSAVNLANLRHSELSSKMSLFELQDFVETLLAEVEKTYWNYALAQRKIELHEESFDLAKKQLEETRTLVDVGKTAEIDLVAAEAEVALRKQDLIKARSDFETTRLKLLRLLNPGNSEFWSYEVVVKNPLDVPEIEVGDVESHVETALNMRPDLNQAKLSHIKNELDVIKTKNGLLPDLNLTISAGQTGYSDALGRSLNDTTRDGNDFQVGLTYQYTVGEKSEKSLCEQYALKKKQAELAIDNLEMIAQEQVRSAWIELESARQQIDASEATRVLQEEKMKAEIEKHRVGKSTSLLVAQAQRDYLSSSISKAQSIANYLIAWVELFRLEGALLERHGISMVETN